MNVHKAIPQAAFAVCGIDFSSPFLDKNPPLCYTVLAQGGGGRKAVRIRREPVAVLGDHVLPGIRRECRVHCRKVGRRQYILGLHRYT